MHAYGHITVDIAHWNRCNVHTMYAFVVGNVNFVTVINYASNTVSSSGQTFTTIETDISVEEHK